MFNWLFKYLFESLCNEEGGSVGQVILGVVGFVIGGLIPGGQFAWQAAMIGAGIGLSVGGILFPPDIESPRPEPGTLQVQTSQYGIAIPVLYGTRKIAGNLIWYGNFQTHEHTESQGGKGGGGVETTSYTYSVGMAFGLCMGTAYVVRIWAGKDEITWTGTYSNGITTYTDKTGTVVARVYHGDHTAGSAYIASYNDTGRNPVWKKLCYIVFEDYDLGNSPHIPNFTFEVTTFPNNGMQEVDVLRFYDTAYSLAGFDYGTTSTFYGDKIYIGAYRDYGGITAGRVYIIDPDTLDSTYHQIDNLKIQWMAVHNGYVYVGDYDHVIHKISMSTWTVVDTIDVGWMDLYGAAGIDPSGTYLYYSYLPGSGSVRIRRINLTTFTYDSGWEVILGGNHRPYEMDIDSAGANLYIISEYTGFFVDPDVTIIIRVNVALETWDYIILTKDFHYPCHVILDEANGYAYCSVKYDRYITGSPPDVKKISLSSFTVVDTLTLDDYIGDCGNLVIKGGNIYVLGTDLSGDYSGMVEISLGTFGVTGYLGLDDYYSNPYYSFPRFFVYPGTGNYLYGVTTSMTIEKIGVQINDALPPDVTKDLLTNDLYGLGLSESLLDTTAFSETNTYCSENDLKVSILFDRQMSVLDALQYVIAHHNGYISYFDGLIAHKQLKQETATETIGPDSIVDDGKGFPVEISKQGERDFKNLIRVEYTNRSREYIKGIAQADDMVDIDAYGRKDGTINLGGLTTFSRAAKMAQVNLRQNLSAPPNLSFKLGPKSLGLKPGDVKNITDSDLELTNYPIRIQSVSEDKDYVISVSARGEADAEAIYDLDVIEDATSFGPEESNLHEDTTDVNTLVFFEMPPSLQSDLSLTDKRLTGGAGALCITYSKPESSRSWGGVRVYRAWDSTGSYTQVATASGTGITGVVDAVGYDGPDAYIDVTLGWSATLSSATSFDDLMNSPRKNLAVVKNATKDIFLRYQTVTLIGTKQWRLKGLIYDVTDIPNINTYGLVTAGDYMGFYEGGIPQIIGLSSSEVNRYHYYKLVSYNLFGLLTNIISTAYHDIFVEGIALKPLAPYNISVNTIAVDADNAITINSGDIALEWTSRNRYNEGGYNYTRTDAIIDDSDFVNFQIDIYNDSTNLMRSVTQTGKSYTYDTTQQSSDGATSPFTIKIKQIGQTDESDETTITVSFA